MHSSTDVDEYIANFEAHMRSRLQEMRQLVATEAPDAVESKSYGLVGYKLDNQPLVYFGGFKSHVGFYATPNGHEAFAKELSQYKQGKGSVQFPLERPLPVDLIKRVVQYRKAKIRG